MAKEEEKAINNLQKLVELRKDKTNEIKYDSCICSTKELDITLNSMQTQQAELEKKDKIIAEMAKSWKQDDVRSEEEIIQYFEKKVDCKRF